MKFVAAAKQNQANGRKEASYSGGMAVERKYQAMNLTDGSSHHCVRTSIILGDQASSTVTTTASNGYRLRKPVKHAMKYADKRALRLHDKKADWDGLSNTSLHYP
jgi:hypothetical protein